MKALVDLGPFMASQAKANGLIDEIGYEDQIYGDLKKKTGAGELNKINIKTYFHAVPGRGDRIAVLVGEGDIVSGHPENSFGNEDVISSGGFSKTIRQVRNDRSIKGVILRVDSPGGDAVASDEILHELKLLSAVKPLVISMSDVAASGGYFIAMTGDPVVSYPNTHYGLNRRPLRQTKHAWLVRQARASPEDMLTRGKMADMDSAYLPLSDAAKQKLHELIEGTYRSFVGKVAAARRKTYDQIDPIAQGRVWMGAQARQNGLVDELGGLDRAIALVRKKANLSAGGETNLVMFPPRRSLFDILANSSPDTLERAEVRKMLPGLPGQAFLRGGMLRMLPYRLIIH